MPSEGGGRVISPQLDPSVRLVSDLFIPGSTTWNETLIDQHFYPWEAAAIKSIPVISFGAVDALIWPMSSDGAYTVKSAYQLLSRLQRQEEASPSDMEAGKSLWNGIWKLRAPNKVRHFLWRVVQNSLSTKLNLYKRQVVSNGYCDVCRTCLEDNIHALWYCDVARAIWQTDVCFNFIRTKKFSTFADIVQFLCSHGSSDLFTRFAMVAWSIWERRNRLRVGQSSWKIDEVVQRASELLHKFQDVQTPVRRAVG